MSDDIWSMTVSTMLPTMIDAEELRKAIPILWVGGKREIRGLPSGRSRLVSADDISHAINAVSILGDSEGIYWTLNPVRNDLGDRAARKGDIVNRQWLLIDIDRSSAVKKAENAGSLMATYPEKDETFFIGAKLADWLQSLGWPSPVYVDSGNGMHLLFRVDLPADEMTRLLIKRVLSTLADKWNTPEVEIDRAVHDANRISKLPGTWVRKGPDTRERPWRISRIKWAPPEVGIVTAEQLSELCGEAPVLVSVPSSWEMAITATPDRREAYVRSGIAREIGSIIGTAVGERNNALNAAAFSIGQFVGAGLIDRASVTSQLQAAAHGVGLEDAESKKTIDSGLDAGIAKPRVLPESVHSGVNGTGPLPKFDPSKDRDATAADLMTANAGTRWLWPQWIPLGVLTLLTAEPSTGKTRLGLDLTRRIALNLEWPDGQPMTLPADRRPVVVWVPADNQHSELVDCAHAFGFPAETIILNSTVANIYGGTDLQDAAHYDDLEARIERQKPALVIIDTITNTSDAKSQDSSDAKRQYKPLQDIAKRTGTAIMCVTHTNIAGKTLGRRADEKTRVTIRMECPDPEHQPKRRKLVVALTRLCNPPPPLGITMGDAGNVYDITPPESPAEGAGFIRPLKLPTPATQEAIGYLASALRAGDMKISTMRTECEHRDPPIDAKQLYNARKYLPIEEYEVEDVAKRKSYKWWKLVKKDDDLNANNQAIDPKPF